MCFWRRGSKQRAPDSHASESCSEPENDHEALRSFGHHFKTNVFNVISMALISPGKVYPIPAGRRFLWYLPH